MQNFVLQFQNNYELKEIWTKSLSQGMLFLPSKNLFSLHSPLQLILKSQDGKFGLLLPARVIQLLDQGKEKGMVVELNNFSRYQRELSSLIESCINNPWNGLKDFTGSIKDSTKKLEVKNSFRSILDEAESLISISQKGNFYQILGLDLAAGKKEIRNAYFTLTKKYHPDCFQGELLEEQLSLIEKAYQIISRAYDVLKNPRKKQEYDFSRGKVVQARDESRKELTTKKIKLAHQEIRKKYGGNIDKAKRIFDDALIALKKGDKKSAAASMKIAISLDPLNQGYKKKLKELE